MESGEYEHLSPSLSAMSAPASANELNINVVIRVRPVLDNASNRLLLSSSSKSSSSKTTTTTTAQGSARREGNAMGTGVGDQATAITFPAAGQIQVEDSIASITRSFEFNVVFEPEATQTEVFEHSGVKRLIDMALDGFACTIFAYGQTSTGKTYTLTGNILQQTDANRSTNVSRSSRERSGAKDVPRQASQKPETAKNIGLIQLSFAYMFEQIKRRRESSHTLYVMTVSYLEVYNEQVLDLLNPSPRPLNVRWSKDKGFYAENLFKVECEDIGDLEGVLEEGFKNRQIRGHSMNDTSSRSHAVMTIMLSSEMPDPEDAQGFIRKEGRVCLVDLAGSEKTKRTNSKGGTFVEANNINCSLLVLGNCIACLADPKRRNGHIPYRDSTLTKLLADSLSGKGMTLMIACVSPKKCDSQETINTLRYASRAKKVRMNPVVQMDPRELLILSLKREVRLLRVENNLLKQTMNKDETKSVDNERVESLTQQAKENHALRNENIQLNLERARLVRDHELVCRENERLAKQLDSLLSSTVGRIEALKSEQINQSHHSLVAHIHDYEHEEEEDGEEEDDSTLPAHLDGFVSSHSITDTRRSSRLTHDSSPNSSASQRASDNTLDLTVRGKSAVTSHNNQRRRM